MSYSLTVIRSVVADLEALQKQIVKSQLDLLNILTDDSQDEWDCAAQTGLLKLEIAQRTIGETQVLLVEAMPVCEPNPQSAVELEATEHNQPPAKPVGAPNESEGTSLTPGQWLERSAEHVVGDVDERQGQIEAEQDNDEAGDRNS